MDHEQLVKAAQAAIDAIFKDRSVAPRVIYHSLNQLQEEIDIMIDALGVVDL